MANTYKVLCSIQSDLLSNDQIANIERAFLALYKNHLSPKASVKVIWLTFEPGQAYLEGQPSAVPTIMAPVENGLDDAVRSQFLYGLLDAWSSITNCERDKVVITAPDQALADQFLIAGQQRIAKSVRFWEMSKFYLRLIKAKIRLGRFEASLNF